MLWWDTSLDPVEYLQRYSTTAGWVSLLSINTTTGAITFQGAVAADFAKLVAVAGTAIVDTTTAQNIAGPKTFTDGLVVEGGPLKISSTSSVAQITGKNTANTVTAIYAGGYTSAGDSGLIQIYSKDHATQAGKIRLYGTDGSTYALGAEVLTDGKVNLPVGLQIDGVDMPAPPTYTSFSPGGDLAGTVHIAKYGRLVTMTWYSLTHASSYTAGSAAAVIPAAYRPHDWFTNCYSGSGGVNRQIIIYDSGLFTFAYYDTTDGGGHADTNTGNGSVSWVSAS